MAIAAWNTQGDGAVVMAPRACVGTYIPGWKRRYEFTFGAATPLMTASDRSFRRAFFSARRIFAFCVRKHVLATIILHTIWICIPLPACSSYGFAIKVGASYAFLPSDAPGVLVPAHHAGFQHVISMVKVDFKLTRRGSATAPSAGISCNCASSSIS